MGCESMLPTGLREKSSHKDGKMPCDVTNTSHPLKEGRVRMVQKLGDKSLVAYVTLKIYSNNYDTYAVISMDKALCKDFGYISLKNSTVRRVSAGSDSKENNRHGFQITPEQRKLDLGPITFYTSDSREVDQWIGLVSENARSQSPPRRPLLPLGQRPARSRSGSNSSRPGSLLLPALEEEGAEE